MEDDVVTPQWLQGAQVTLQPVDHDPWADGQTQFTDPMSGATVPQLQAGGQGVINAAHHVVSLPQRLTQASEELRATAGSDNPQYNPAPALEMMQTMAGVGGPAAMIGRGATLGAAGGVGRAVAKAAESLGKPAVKVGDRIFEGDWHGDAFNSAQDALGAGFEKKTPVVEGYTATRRALSGITR